LSRFFARGHVTEDAADEEWSGDVDVVTPVTPSGGLVAQIDTSNCNFGCKLIQLAADSAVL
jgi:hypothetical protein